MKPIIFIHIPKTAGTSFRYSCRNYFGESKCVLDYGLEDETSQIARLWNSQQIVKEDYIKVIMQSGCQFISGHFHASKYTELFSQYHFVSFIRDPIERVISEYNHISAKSGYSGSFKSFYRMDSQKNRQTKLLKGIHIGKGAQIGVTERFNESLCMINKAFGIELKPLAANKTKKKIVSTQKLSEEVLLELKNLNEDDINLYNNACKALDFFSQTGDLYTDSESIIKGHIGGIRNGKIFGWAFEETRKALVELEIMLNDSVLGALLANNERQDIIEKFGIPCAFEYVLPESIELKKGDVISIKQKGTNIYISELPFIVGNEL